MLMLIPVKTNEHIEWLRIHRSRPEIYKYFRQDAPLTIEQQAKWWRNLDKNSVRLFLIEDDCLDGNRKRVGYVGFNPFYQRGARAEFGLFILPEYQNNGYGTKALQALLAKGFTDYNLSTIYSDCLDYVNEKRFDFYHNLGFEAYPREHQNIRYKKQDKWVPSIKFFMTKDMWSARRVLNGKNGNGRLEPIGTAAASKEGIVAVKCGRKIK